LIEVPVASKEDFMCNPPLPPKRDI